jgi:hypothetical protein
MNKVDLNTDYSVLLDEEIRDRQIRDMFGRLRQHIPGIKIEEGSKKHKVFLPKHMVRDGMTGIIIISKTASNQTAPKQITGDFKRHLKDEHHHLIPKIFTGFHK